MLRAEFLRKNLDTFHVVTNLYRIPIPKFHFERLLFGLAQGLCKFLLLT